MRKNTYVIDSENGAEIARLIQQDQLITKAMGGLFPPEVELSDVRQVLDIGCGSGGWVQEVAFQYPQIVVTGIDAHPRMIGYARALAKVQALSNARFVEADATEPLPFADGSFQVVTARFANAFLPTFEAWRGLVREMYRVATPGGLLRLTEADDPGLTNSPGFERMKALAQQAGQVDRRPFPITPCLRRLLREVDCQDLHTQAYALPFAVEDPAYQGHYENCCILFQVLQPFLLRQGVATQEELHTVYEQLVREMWADDFAGIWFLLSVWGYKAKDPGLQATPPPKRREWAGGEA
jgi:ubiquinone/menaquinone biosynthesis C-methylase UbiE